MNVAIHPKSAAVVLGRIYEEMRQAGIREARRGHHDRYRRIQEFKANPAMFFNAIHPSLCTQEAIEDANRYIYKFRRLETWQQVRCQDKLVNAKERRVFARFFRRYGLRIWARTREVAA